MKNRNNISVLDSFTEYPGLRHCSVSDDSGEEFYHTVLNSSFKQAIDKNEVLVVCLDGTAGYAPSFLDEAFGNLVYDFSLSEVKEKIEIVSEEEPSWIEMIFNETFMQWEQRRIRKETPKITGEHPAWYRLNDGKLELGTWS
jgi:hypothetical protein